MGKKIGFTGPFSDTNLGDYAMMLNNVFEMEEKEITLFTFNLPFSQHLAKDYLADYQVTLCEIQLKQKQKRHSFPQHLLHRLGLWSPPPDQPSPIELLHQLINHNEVSSCVEALDVLVVSGGGFFNHLWNSGVRQSSLISMIIPILLAKQMHKKIIFASNTYGPFDQSWKFFFHFFLILENVTFACRDTVYSQATMHSLGIDRERLPYVPDDLLFLHPQLQSLKKSCALPQGDYLVLELYDCLSLLKQYQSLFRDFVRTMKEKYGLSILFLPFNAGDGGMDQGLFLQQCCPEIKLYDLNHRGYLPIEDAANLIAHAQFVVSNRYHALVLAVAAGVPAIQILKNVCGNKGYYYSKGMGVLKEIFSGIAFDEREYLKVDLKDTLEELMQCYPSILKSQRSRYGDIYQENMKRLRLSRKNYYLQALDGNTKKEAPCYGKS